MAPTGVSKGSMAAVRTGRPLLRGSRPPVAGLIRRRRDFCSSRASAVTTRPSYCFGSREERGGSGGATPVSGRPGALTGLEVRGRVVLERLIQGGSSGRGRPSVGATAVAVTGRWWHGVCLGRRWPGPARPALNLTSHVGPLSRLFDVPVGIACLFASATIDCLFASATPCATGRVLPLWWPQ